MSDTAPFVQGSPAVTAPGVSPVQIRHQRRTALLCALLVAPFALLDVAQATSPSQLAVVLLARLAWTLSLLGGAALLGGTTPRPAAAAGLMGATTAGAVLVIVAATGGPRGGYFAFLLLMPLCMQVLLPGHLLAATASGVAGIAAGGLMLWGAGTGAFEIVRWVGTGVAGGAIAAYASHAGGALFRRELAAARASAEAAAALALSERRRATSERLAVVGRLAAGVAHEINNPLAFVKANLVFASEAVSSPSPDGPGAREALGPALSDALLGVERIRRIVADLRDFAREDADEPCETDCARAVEEALRLASVRTRRTAVLVDVAGALPPLRICRKRLVQVLLNLLVNAADAVEEVDDERRRWIAVAVALRGDEISLVVEDGGAGLPPEALAHLFEPFFTTKPPGAGTGLGLALSHEYVSAVGGRLSGENGPHGGARFEVRLPVRRAGPAGCTACARDAGGAHACA
jgi:signal transduction histidine kinase